MIGGRTFPLVSVLEIKQGLSRLNAGEVREIEIYLHKLKRDTPAARRATAKKLDAIKAGKFVTADQLEARIRRG